MIKGCSRKVIVIKNPGSNLFEEAYFIVNPKESERKHGDFLLEANRIIASKTVPDNRGKSRAAGLLFCFLGFLMGIFTALPIACFLAQ